MIKKFLPAFLITLLLVLVYSFFVKENPLMKKTPEALPTGTTQPTTSTVEPTQSVISPTAIVSQIFLQVDEPADNATVSGTSVKVSGKTIANAFVFINEKELKADAQGNFSTTVALEEGENYILVVAVDNLGNSAEKEILVNLESTQ